MLDWDQFCKALILPVNVTQKYATCITIFIYNHCNYTEYMLHTKYS